MSSHGLALQKITKDSFYSICQLSVSPEQVNHVDSNAISMAEANFSDHAWMRGIYLNGAPIGFVMVDAQVERQEFYLWRFIIDQQFQKRGLGKLAIELLVVELNTEFGAKNLCTSVVTELSGPKTFYERLGFIETGNLIEGRELELKLTFKL